MIIKNNDQLVMKFGAGDICVAGGYTDHGNGLKTGFVIFTNGEPGKIGRPGTIKAGEVDLNDYPVVMVFDKKESIDVVIEHLEISRECMI